MQAAQQRNLPVGLPNLPQLYILLMPPMHTAAVTVVDASSGAKIETTRAAQLLTFGTDAGHNYSIT